jgi:2-polyprenyl-3-methyl-5-hydroxy-6-metoxy-1,4-benzoquinol methylase
MKSASQPHTMAKIVSSAEERVKVETWIHSWTVAEHNALYDFTAKFVRGKHVVDFACGKGIGTRFFIQRGLSVIHGFDLDEEAMQYALRHFDKNNVFFKKTFALPLPLLDAECRHLHDGTAVTCRSRVAK